jgi:FkbM family methyltransferase
MIYIDLGCHNGKTIRDYFTSHEKIKSVGIDPLGSKYHNAWEEIRKELGTLFVKMAAMDFSGEIEFSERSDDVKSSVMSDKVRFDTGKIYKVDCFDFSKFLRDNFKKNERFYIRMDIEGAEYPVLLKMIKDGMMLRVDQLDIEWHGEKMEDQKYKEQEREIKSFLETNSIKYTEFI